MRNKIRNTALLFLASYFLFLSPTTAQAQEVNLVWQGETITPPFYKGLPLWSKQSRITLVAIPQGLGNPANLNYKWTKNGTVLGNINGLGRNNLSFVDSVLSRPQNIEVEILSGQNTVLAKTSVVVRPTSPELVIYEDNPLYGIMFDREVGNSYKLSEREITFTAFPLFFTAQGRNDTSLSYLWETNAGGLETRSSATYRVPEKASGSSQISTSVSSETKILQTAGKSFLVQFEQ